MEKKYAIIENGIVANIIVCEFNPSIMTELQTIEFDKDQVVDIDYLFINGEFIKNIF